MYNPAKSMYLNPNIEFLFNGEIIEYDMRDAGFSIIKQYKLLSDMVINQLAVMEKMDRVINIGKLQGQDKDFSNALLDKFTELRTLFISSNRLQDGNIISVKKDAIFTIGKCSQRKFGDIEFVEKNRYSSYIRFTNNSNIELYYNEDKIDIKGIGEIGINRHRLYLIDFIDKVIKYIEAKNPYVKKYIKDFIMKYKTKTLDEGFYIEFNNMSQLGDDMFNYQKLLIPLVQIVLGEFDE